MLLPKGGVTWKSARSRLPPWRVLIVYLTKVRVLAAIALTGLIMLLWRGISVSTKDLSKFVPFQYEIVALLKPHMILIIDAKLQLLLLWTFESTD